MKNYIRVEYNNEVIKIAAIDTMGRGLLMSQCDNNQLGIEILKDECTVAYDNGMIDESQLNHILILLAAIDKTNESGKKKR